MSDLSRSHHGGGALSRRVDPLEISGKGTNEIRMMQIFFHASPVSLCQSTRWSLRVAQLVRLADVGNTSSDPPKGAAPRRPGWAGVRGKKPPAPRARARGREAAQPLPDRSARAREVRGAARGWEGARPEGARSERPSYRCKPPPRV